VKRRAVLETIAAAGVGALFAPLLAAAAEHPDTGVTPVLTQDLPALSLDGWVMSAVEVSYAPGQVDRAHKHPGFVFGYVLEGDLRFKVDGGEETVYHAGQMFYEKPGSVHRVSANASTTAPCRFLALVFGDKKMPRTEPV
jgi:quercetin dioxygenase-like cupin family protein